MKSPDSVTVLVFKDNYASRSFQVPLNWFSRLGMLLGVLLGACMITGVFALKFYRLAQQTPLPAGPVPVIAAAPIAAPPVTASAPTVAVAAAPAPTVTVTVTAAAPPAAKEAAKTLTAPTPMPGDKALPQTALFSALPIGTVPPPPADHLPIAVKNVSFSWGTGSHKLAVKFDVQYVTDDKGTQQGRIILLGRGPDVLFAYPAGALNRAQSPSLIDPGKGEFFSVSRVRNTVAEFGPLPARGAITEIEAIILSSTGQLLIHDTIPVELPKAAPAPKRRAAEPRVTEPADSAAPATPGAEAAPAAGTTPPTTPGDAQPPSKTLEPGYDQ